MHFLRQRSTQICEELFKHVEEAEEQCTSVAQMDLSCTGLNSDNFGSPQSVRWKYFPTYCTSLAKSSREYTLLKLKFASQHK